jgi:two-component system, OmpR family, sensor histidine kinase CreC
MRLGLRLMLGFLLIIGLATYFVMRVFVHDVKPGVRQAMEATLIDTANVLAALAGPDLKAGRIGDGAFATGWRAARARDLRAKVWQFDKRALAFRISVTDARGIVVFDSEGRDVGRDNSRWNDVRRTLAGQYGARSSLEPSGGDGDTAMHVAAPIYDPDAPAGVAPPPVLGVLTVSQANRTYAPFILSGQRNILRRGAWLIGLSALIGCAMTWWLMVGISRLHRYAQAVSAGARAAPPAPRNDELGDLGGALEQMRRKLDGKAYVEQYVHALTHELKGPLAGIRAAAELLRGPLPEPERQRFLQNIESQQARLTETIDKLLALAEVEQHGGLREVSDVAVPELMHEAAHDVASAAAAVGVTVVVDDGAAPPLLRGDPYLLRQALRNLLDNALAFAPPGSAVTLAAARDGERLRLRVSDSGPGVPSFAAARVFERFYSLPRPRSGQRSSGLGLPFVREVARLHDGAAELRNRAPDDGAVATLWLPLPR